MWAGISSQNCYTYEGDDNTLMNTLMKVVIVLIVIIEFSKDQGKKA